MKTKPVTIRSIDEAGDELHVDAYVYLYGDAGQVDLYGTYFDRTTDYRSRYVETNTVAVDWEHGMKPDRAADGTPVDQPGADDVLGRVDMLTARSDDLGLLTRLVLNRRDRYVSEFVEPLARAGLLATSSEAIATGVRFADDGHADLWPLKRVAFTVMPGETRMLTDAQVSVIDRLPEEFRSRVRSALQGAPTTDAATPTAASNVKPAMPARIKKGTSNMNDQDELRKQLDEMKAKQAELAAMLAPATARTVTPAEIEATTESVRALTGVVNQLLTDLADDRKARGTLVAPDSEDDHAEIRSFGDFCVAVKNGNTRRLDKVYGSKRALSEGDGSAGGFLVPTEYDAMLLRYAAEESLVRPRATVIPNAAGSGEVPALDQETAPTAGVGQSAFAGGVRMYWVAEAGSVTETTPAFKMIEYNLKKAAGYTKASNELRRDNAVGLEALLFELFGAAIAAIEDYSFIRGTGAGMPLGALAAPAAIGITPDTNNAFARSDAAEILSRFAPRPGRPESKVWAMHRTLIPDLEANFGVRVSGTDLVQPREALPTELMGYGIKYNEHLPVADTSGCALLADWSAYLIFDGPGTTIAFSEHAAFLTDEAVWRVTKRVDGMPWLTGAITLADPGGATTVSPFVYLND